MASNNYRSYAPDGRGFDSRYYPSQYDEAFAESAAMDRNYSAESYDSTESRQTRVTNNSSPNTASTFNIPPSGYVYGGYGGNYYRCSETMGDPEQHQALSSHALPSPTSTLRSSQQVEKTTPSMLGWTSETFPVHLYSFQVRKGREPYLSLLSSCVPTPQTPARVYLDQYISRVKGVGWICQFPGPCGKDFKRSADLERHYMSVHADEKCQSSFFCDYKRCSRSKPGSEHKRKDHHRAHYREFHKEDIGHAKHTRHGKALSKREIEKADVAWREERNIDPTWWRCSKDLTRTIVAEGGWICATCHGECEPERVEARMPQSAGQEAGFGTVNEQTAMYGSSSCRICAGTGWGRDASGNDIVCSLCYPNSVPATMGSWDTNQYW